MGSNVYEDMVIQAREDRRLSGTEFRLFHAIVHIYKSNPERCNLSQRKWGQLSGTASGGVGEIIVHLEELGYIHTTKLIHRGHQSLYVTVLKDGKPLIATGETPDRTPRWEEVQSYELPEGGNGNGDMPKYRITIAEWQAAGKDGHQDGRVEDAAM